MVRTMDSGARASGAKAPKKGLSGVASGSAAANKGGGSGASGGSGNPMCHRETPAWQKPISSFFKKGDGEGSGSPAGPRCGEDDDDAIRHVDKKVRLSSEDTDEEKENQNDENAPHQPSDKRELDGA